MYYRKGRKPMEAARKWSPYIFAAVILTLIAVIAICLLNGKPTPEIKKVYIPGKETVKYIPGTPDTVTKYITQKIYIEKPAGQHFGKDSSTYTIRNEHGRAEVTTYPATDSIRIEVEPVTIERLITRVDTLKLDRIDTLKITTTITGDQPWYDTFLTGFITAVLAVAGVIGAFAL